MHISNNGNSLVGLAYMPYLSKNILKNLSKIDLVEVYTSKFFAGNNDLTLNKIISQIPLILHGLDFTIGSEAEAINPTYQTNLQKVFNNIKFEWFSEHLAINTKKNDDITNFSPVSLTSETAELIISKVREIKQMSSCPFLLENVVFYPTPSGNLSEHEFIKTIIEGSDCGMILDLNNIFINSKNHVYDPYEFIKKLPLDRVVEIHLAGGAFEHGIFFDTHSHPIPQQVWELFDFVCKNISFNAVVIERESDLENFDDILIELELARSIINKNSIRKST